jgi:hypothetical protein
LYCAKKMSYCQTWNSFLWTNPRLIIYFKNWRLFFYKSTKTEFSLSSRSIFWNQKVEICKNCTNKWDWKGKNGDQKVILSYEHHKKPSDKICGIMLNPFKKRWILKSQCQFSCYLNFDFLFFFSADDDIYILRFSVI